MKYWKYIELDNWELIRDKTITYLRDHTLHLLKEHYRGPFIHLNAIEYVQHVPEVLDSGKRWGLTWEMASIFVMFDNKDCVPHKDYTDTIGRINIPLLNCRGSTTYFYDNLTAKRLMLPTGAPFYATVNKDYRIVDSVEIDRPTAIKVGEGHSVKMVEGNFPRVTLTLAYNPDVGLLIDDDTIL